MRAELALAAAAALMVACLGAARADEAPAPAPTHAASAGLDYKRWETADPGTFATDNRRTNLVQRGRLVYEKYCVGCHGENGDGKGPAAARLITKPRDFTQGIYKFRSTDSGSLPLEQDLYRTITRGLPRVSMPSFPLMPEPEKVAVIEYVKGFYPRWEEEKGSRKVVLVPRAPADISSHERALRGRLVYEEMGCGRCHGVDGRGTGATQTEYVDAWGNKQKPFDFTRGRLKAGDSPEDIYRTFHTGLRSIMPAFDTDTLALVTRETITPRLAALPAAERGELDKAADDFPASADAVAKEPESKRSELGERNSWDLVSYVMALSRRKTTADAVVGKPKE
jgi:cytochrome c oxidase cbb3-type subunit 2